MIPLAAYAYPNILRSITIYIGMYVNMCAKATVDDAHIKAFDISKSAVYLIAHHFNFKNA